MPKTDVHFSRNSMTPKTQAAHLRASVAKAASAFHADCITKFPGESPYGLILYSDNDGQTCGFIARTEEEFQRQELESPGTAERWDMAAWEMRDYGRNAAQTSLNMLWMTQSDAVSKTSRRRILGLVFEAFVEGLQDFLESGVAEMNGQTGRLVIFVAIGDPDENLAPKLNAWARRLNPDATDLWFHRVGNS